MKKSDSTEINPQGGADVAGIAKAITAALPQEAVRATITEIGQVVYVGDGVVKISGLPSARMENIVTIRSQRTKEETSALILGITQDLIEAVVMGDYTFIRQGDLVISEGKKMQVPVGEPVLGRIINPLGEPIDGGPAIHSKFVRDVEYPAPGVAKRKPVEQQLESGILVVDTLIPLGKGQRELVIGDRKSGKTTLMANFISNQKGKNVYCIYVAIGAQKAKIRSLEEKLRKNGALEYTTIVMGCSDDPPSLNYIAPYVGATLGEYFMYSGKEAIVIYDDLSRQAKAYRQMSLLLKRSPGRDAYPGDIFYLHSRLLERAARLLPEYGGGSLTAFPMAETQNGDVSEYICTNLMSITDGHIYLDFNFLHEGLLPAVNSSVSVSRIGGGVQSPCLRKLGELASKQMARFNEVKSFENINTEISDATEKELKVGKHLLEIFAQDSSICLENDEKIILLYLVTSGRTHDMEIKELRRMKVELIDFYRAHYKDFFAEKSMTAKEVEDVIPDIMKIVEDFAKQSDIQSMQYIITALPAAEKATPIIPEPTSEEPKNQESNKEETEKKA